MQKKENKSYEKTKAYAALKKAYERLIKIRGQPREIAQGFALGVFIGMSPSMGFQTPIAIFLASLLKWNKISAAVGVWISNPLTAPVLYGVTYLIGANLLGISTADKLSDDFESTSVITMLSKAPEIIWALALGGVVMGIPFSIAAYYFCYSAVQRYQEDFKRKLALQKEKLAKKRQERSKKKKKKKKR